MASRALVGGLALCAAGLGVALALGRGPAPPRGRTIVPELAGTEPRAIAIAGPGLAVRLERTGTSWALRAPLAAPADPAAVRELVATLRGLTRRGVRALAPAGATTVRLELDDGAAIELAISPIDAATDRAWLWRDGGGDASLIEGYEARALAPTAASLRDRRPLRGASAATAVRVALVGRTAEVGGTPPALRIFGGTVRTDPAAVGALIDALERLTLDPVDLAATGELAVEVTMPARTLRLTGGGPCPGHADQIALATPLGTGCTDAAWLAGFAALADPAALVDRRLFPAIERATAVELVRGPATVGSADPATIRAVLGAREPGELVARDPRWAVAGALRVTASGGAVAAIDLLAMADGRLAIARPGEAGALVPGADRQAFYQADPWRFRALDLIASDPTRVHAVRAERAGRALESLSRGELLEDWTGQPGPADRAAAARVALALAELSARRFVAARPAAGHGLGAGARRVTVELDADPAGGAAEVHTIVLGAATATGCFAQLDRDPTVVELDRERCQALAGPWTAR